jgi:hypothetical protein
MACVSAYALAQNGHGGHGGHGNRGRTDLLGFAGPRLTAWLSHEYWQRVAVPTRREQLESPELLSRQPQPPAATLSIYAVYAAYDSIVRTTVVYQWTFFSIKKK